MTRRIHFLLALLVIAAPRFLSAQERGATALGEAVAGLDVTPRVLVIGAHPDDEDTQLITWLARGRQVETAYLSLTRGDGGQNLIGNELGVMLGMIRTEELLAARRLDGGRQFFTRAYDFGFSKTAEETYKHWPKDSIMRDVVTVVRAFRPQIIVAVFSGTPRDGHGHHQVSAMLAREVYDAAADTVAWPRSRMLGLGAWTPLKFYRASRFNPQEATLTFNVGELSPFRGQSYAEIASLSRSQHLSQGFGVLQRRGTSLDYLKLEQSRVSEPLKRETSPLQDIASDWSRFNGAPVSPTVRALVDSLPRAIAAVRAVGNLATPDAMVAPLARVVRLTSTARNQIMCTRFIAAGCNGVVGDLVITLETAERRAQAALLAAAGVLVEATASRELLAVGDTLPVTISVYNQGRNVVGLTSASAWTFDQPPPRMGGTTVPIAPDSTGRATLSILARSVAMPWWLANGRVGDIFAAPPSSSPIGQNVALGEDRVADTHARVWLNIAGTSVDVDAGPIIYRFADPARGELRHPVAIVPAVSVLFDNDVEYARSKVSFARPYTIRLRSASTTPRSVTVSMKLPGSTVELDAAERHVALAPFTESVVSFVVHGNLPTGTHAVNAEARSGNDVFDMGYLQIRYPHIRPLRYYRPPHIQLEAVDAKLPPRTTVAYIRGVGDNVAPMLAQLGMKVTMLTPEELAERPLSEFGAIVVGPRAFATSEALTANAGVLQNFARAGGTVVVQYGQQEMQAPGILPYPITLSRTAERVTLEDAPQRILDPGASLLAKPNRITLSDFDNWVQERSTYMPTTADPHYQRLLEMHDPDAPPNENAVLVAPLGKGAYVYVTLALFRQLPAGVPGPARLFLNLLAADGKTTGPVRVQP